MLSLFRNRYKNRFGPVPTLCLFLLLVPGSVKAQQYYDPGLLQKTVDRTPTDYQSNGIRMGGFMLKTGAELALENNDNIFALETLTVSDSIVHVRPWLNLNSNWNRHELNVSAFADIARYDDYGSEDYEDIVFNLNGRVDVKRGSAFNYTVSSMQLHEDRSSPDDVDGIRPTEFSLSGFDVGYTHTFNRLTATLGYRKDDTDYDNNIDGTGNVLDTQDRDRSRDAVSLRLEYERSEKSGVFFSAQSNKLDYDQKVDNQGYQRSSEGYDLRGGISWAMTGVLTGDLYLQYLQQEYDEPTFSDIDGFGIGASLLWTPTQLTHVDFRFANAPQETTQANTSGYYSSLYSVRIQHELRRQLLANARLSYTDNQYEYNGTDTDSLNDTQVSRAEIGLSYLVNRHVHISGGYAYEKQAANTSIFEYKRNTWFLTLSLEL